MGSEQQTSGNPIREFIRHTVDVPLEVDAVDDAEPRPERGFNVSRGGLAFASTTRRRVGEILRIRIRTAQPAFEARARVAWCRPESEGFLVGVQFLDSGAAFRSRMVQQVSAIERYRKEVHQREGRVLTAQEAAAEWITKYAERFPSQ